MHAAFMSGGDKILLAERKDNKTAAEYVFQYNNVKNLTDRFEAIQFLKDEKSPEAKQIKKAALKDKHWFIRNMGLGAIEPDAAVLEEAAKLAVGDINSKVRANALDFLTNAQYEGLGTIAGKVLDNEKAYPVIGSALLALNQANPVEAVKRAEQLEGEAAHNPSILSAIGGIYAIQGKFDKLSFFEKNWDNIDGPEAGNFFHNYAGLLLSNGGDIKGSLGKLKDVSTNMSQSLWRRFSATQTLVELNQFYNQMLTESTDETVKTIFKENVDLIKGYIQEIKAAETNPQLKSAYSGL